MVENLSVNQSLKIDKNVKVNNIYKNS